MSQIRIKKGQWAESLVENLLRSRNYRILASNLKTPWAQIDLLVESQQGQPQIIEVKYLSSWIDPEFRVSLAQRKRLLNAQKYLQGQYAAPVGLYVAFVSAAGKCSFVELQSTF